MEGLDYLTYLNASIFDMMVTHMPVFALSGRVLFGSFALIRLINFLRHMGGAPHGDHVNGFWDLMMELGIGFAMVAFYQTPIPGTGLSFSHLIVDQAQWLTAQLDAESLSAAYTSFDGIQSRFIPPGFMEWIATGYYFLVVAALTIAKIASLAVVAFGLIASAICMLVGPLFVPFFILPWLNWMFWGWLKAFVQYSFMPVIAMAYVLVGTRFVVAVLSSLPAGITSDLFPTYGLQVVVVAGTFVVGLLFIPSLTASIFSGHGAQSAIDLVRSRW